MSLNAQAKDQLFKQPASGLFAEVGRNGGRA